MTILPRTKAMPLRALRPLGTPVVFCITKTAILPAPPPFHERIWLPWSMWLLWLEWPSVALTCAASRKCALSDIASLHPGLGNHRNSALDWGTDLLPSGARLSGIPIAYPAILSLPLQLAQNTQNRLDLQPCV